MTIGADLAPLLDLADGLDGPVMRDVLAQSAEAQSEHLTGLARRESGGDGRLSNLRGGGTATADVTSISATQSVVELRPAGVWSLMFGGASPHLIRGRFLAFDRPAPSRRRRGASRVRSGVVRHPGTAGSPALAAAGPAMLAETQRITDDVLEQAVP